MMNILTWIDGPVSGFNFTIDANTVMLGLISGLIMTVAWFGRKWALGIETQIGAIHIDMKEHNDRSDKTHERVFKAIAIDSGRISKIEGKLEASEED